MATRIANRPFSYSTKESGSSVIFTHFYTRRSMEWRKRAFITIVHVRKFFKLHQNIVRFRFFLRIAKRCIPQEMASGRGGEGISSRFIAFYNGINSDPKKF